MQRRKYNIHRIVHRIGQRTDIFIAESKEVVSFIGDCAYHLYSSVIHLRRVRWRETLYYMDMTGSRSLPIVLAVCFLMGIIMAFQSAVQLRKFGSEFLVADLVAFAIIVELGPLMVAMIATGRAGSAFAAEIGTMKTNEEVDALVTMGISPIRFLVIPKLLAMMLMMPILTVFGNAAGVLGGMFIGVTVIDLPAASYWTRTVTALGPLDITLSLLKGFFFAILIALIGCYRGFQATPDAQGVGRAATSAVVTSIFAVIIADLLVAVFYMLLGYT